MSNEHEQREMWLLVWERYFTSLNGMGADPRTALTPSVAETRQVWLGADEDVDP